MPLNLEEGHFNISSFFRVFWSERGSALEYGEDFARIMTVAIRFERYPYSSSRTWEKKTHSINIHKQAFTPDVQI